MKAKPVIAVLVVLLVGIATVLFIKAESFESKLSKTEIELSNTTKTLKEKTKEIKLIYDEIETLIEENNKLKQQQSQNPAHLIKVACDEIGVDYELALAISKFETARFTSDVYVQYHNVGGIRGENGDWKSYSSLAEGVNDYVLMLKKYYISQGLTTLSTIQPKYCPNSQGGQHWLEQVTIIMKEVE